MAVENKESVLTLVRKHQDQMQALGVKRLGLFGSFVRNEPNSESDIDLLVEFESGRKTFDNFMRLSFLLEALFGRKVELITPESLSPYLRPHILQEVEYVAFIR